jgi:NAD(P)H-dependent flavin oxidoreductase YrpB (nitropropane dioxygenase family)
MLKTAMTEMIGIRHPIIQAGMGPFRTKKLAVAVANAGGLGIIAGIGMAVAHMGYKSDFGTKLLSPREALLEEIEFVKNGTMESQGIFGVNVPVNKVIKDVAKELIYAALEAREKDPEVAKRMKVIITSAGSPAPYIKDIQASGAFHFQVVPSGAHAKKMEDLGTNLIIASGQEGGGHVSSEPVHTMVLLPEVVEKVRIPVVGTGGFCDGKGLAAALALGAAGIQMGTRFIATQECDFRQSYKEKVLSITDDRDTVVTKGVFGELRYLKSPGSLKLAELVKTGAPEKETWDLEVQSHEAIDSDDPGEKAAWPGGESAARVDDIPTAKELIERTVSQAEEVIKGLPRFIV